jgi:hypothetical protein
MHEATTTFVGLDVHKNAIAVAIAKPGRAPARFLGTTPPTLASVRKALTAFGAPKRVAVVYEAGPCGYRLARELCADGYRCAVVAPVRDIAWRAQRRLCARYRRLQARGVHQNKICIAIARELTAFIWDIARHVPLEVSCRFVRRVAHRERLPTRQTPLFVSARYRARSPCAC